MTNNEKIVFIFSAIHTGTFFTINLMKASVENSLVLGVSPDVEVIHDMNFFKRFRVNAEDFIDAKKIRELRYHTMILIDGDNDPDLIIVQAHNKHNSTLYEFLCGESVSPVPVVVPMRNPFLSILTRWWRNDHGTGRVSDEDRILEATKQLDSIERLAAIPRENVIFFPIDVGESKELAGSVVQNCGLSVESVTSYIQEWPVSNATEANGMFPVLKMAILNGDKDFIAEHMGPEFSCVTKWARKKSVQEKLRSFGYNDLWWLHEK
jgi:hypothetical protein